MFQKYSNHLKILGARREVLRTFHNKDPKILVATAQNLVPIATWRQGFVNLCYNKVKYSNIRLCLCIYVYVTHYDYRIKQRLFP
jgi:hypothetical protein